MYLSLLVSTLITAASAIDLKGVPPSQVDAYKIPIPGSSPPRWKCLNSSQEIPHSAVNDNYCDCEDGTDEPGKPLPLHAREYFKLNTSKVLERVRLAPSTVSTRVTLVFIYMRLG
jgi:hypothetical protein